MSANVSNGNKRAARKNHNETSTSEGTIAPPDGGWGWMVVFGSFMIHVIIDGVTYSFGIFYDEFLQYFKNGKSATAWILSIMVGFTYCSGPISSLMVNRFGCRIVTIIGAILAACCLVLSIFATNVYFLYASIGIGTGFGFGLIYLPAIVSVSSYFERKRSLATGIAVCGSGLGTFIFAPFITWLLKLFEWQTVMLIIAGIVSSCVMFGLFFKPLKAKALERSTAAGESLPVTYNNYLNDTKKSQTYGALSKSDQHEGYRNKTKFHTERVQMFSRSLINVANLNMEAQQLHPKVQKKRKLFDWGLCKNPLFIIFSLSNFLTSIGYNVPYVYIVSLAKSIDLTGDQAGHLLSAIGISNTISRIILGYAADKRCVNRLIIYNICLTICGIATSLTYLCNDFYSLVFYSCVFGSTIGAYVGLTSVILVDLLGLDKLTNAFGLLLLFQGLASLIGPPLAGFLFDISQSYVPGFIMAGVTIAVSGAMLFVVPCMKKCETRRREIKQMVRARKTANSNAGTREV